MFNVQQQSAYHDSHCDGAGTIPPISVEFVDEEKKNQYKLKHRDANQETTGYDNRWCNRFAFVVEHVDSFPGRMLKTWSS